VLRALKLGGPSRYWLDGGGFRLDGGAMFGAVPRPRWSALYPPADDGSNTIPLTAHVLLVQHGSSWGLLDSGFGHHLADRQRRFYSLERESQLEPSLAELGISPSQVDWVILTHLYLDHADGAALLYLGDLLVTHAHLPPRWSAPWTTFRWTRFAPSAHGSAERPRWAGGWPSPTTSATPPAGSPEKAGWPGRARPRARWSA
jgi:glyoxylase-like metal-dependent hydrolase (beta-lactamase superfamily II)